MRTGDDDEYRMVMAAAEAAKLAERERCAKIAEDEGCYEYDCRRDIAERIRSGE